MTEIINNTCPGDKYRVISLMKKDHKGSVYLAEHRTMGAQRVIKEVSVHSLYKESIISEAYILKNLNHQYIPTIFDIEQDENSIYIIEEYIQGTNLYDYIKENGVFSQESAILYGIKLAEIIDFLHSRNSFKVCHLDIQPKNIIINKTDVYLVDFGNGKSTMNFEATGNLMATEGFAPPEQYSQSFMKDIEDGIKADIYGFGAVLLYMICGMITDVKPEDMLLGKGACEELIHIITSALSSRAEFRQITAATLKNQLLSIGKPADKLKEAEKNKPYVISVAGICHGAGATHVSIALVSALAQKGISVAYEENNNSNAVRTMAKHWKDIQYDKGYFVYGGCRLKPQYNKNVHICREEKVVVRDEGVLDTDGKYGQVIIIVMKAGILGMAVTKEALAEIELCRTKHIGKMLGVFNACSEKAYRASASELPVISYFVPFFENPFETGVEDISIVSVITGCLRGAQESVYSTGNKEKRKYILHRKDKNSGHHIWKKG